LAREVTDASGQLLALKECVEALALCRLERYDESRAALDRATSLIPRELATLGIVPRADQQPLDESLISHDWLIPEVLRREAEALLEAAP
jgi:hypothetical protein